MRNSSPQTLVEHGKNPYIGSHVTVDDADNAIQEKNGVLSESTHQIPTPNPSLIETAIRYMTHQKKKQRKDGKSSHFGLDIHGTCEIMQEMAEMEGIRGHES
ncbi:hypothetical protein Salat_2069000 [Sesamum alatum]|uniref:Uncharacterized protein n=1 Tax=Sesamum alatum TaxID=300844 RepID=A0AAE1Y005_9LAMI|nr:hypothetical protein Salat_2069000 [Sesamum alatum]